MTNKLQFGLAAAVVLGFSLVASSASQGQLTAPASSSRVATAQPRTGRSLRPITRRNGGSSAAGPRATSNGFAPAVGSSLSLQQLLDPVPPPGFDYAYLSAIDSDLAIKALIDPVTQWRLATAERFLHGTRGTGFGSSGFYLLDAGGEYTVPEEPAASDQPAPQPQIFVLQQAPAAQQTEAQAATEPEMEAVPPLPDVGQFTLVLHNGTQIQAVAFTLLNNKIVYITAEGSRRTIALADLDSAATVRVNEEQGIPLQLPM